MIGPDHRIHSFVWQPVQSFPFAQDMTHSNGAFLSTETVQTDVEPGEKTGVYHILLCNLPFGTSWQALWAFTSSVCLVDHVQVFPGSTSGWVRVVGKGNFEKAWKLLNGGNFNGRSIIASDRNKNETIKIKEHVGTPAPRTSYDAWTAWPRYFSTSTTPNRQESPASNFSSSSASSSSSSSHPGMPSHDQSHPSNDKVIWAPQPVTVANINMVLPALSNFHPVTSRFGQADGTIDNCQGRAQGSSLAGGMTSVGYGLGPQSSYPFPYRITHITQVEASPRFNPRQSGWGTPDSYVKTEPRKIFITPFTQTASAAEITVWIHAKLGSYRAKIADISIPHRGPESCVRGHALVVFKDANSALKAIAMLDRIEFRGRPVRARLATEGVVVCDSPPPINPALLDAINVRRYGINHSRTRSRGISSSTRDTDSRNRNLGTSSRTGERKERDPSGPVIVNGSSIAKTAAR